MIERAADLWVDSYAGRIKQPVVVIGETPKRYRVRALQRTRLGGRARSLEAGETALVPRGAVHFRADLDWAYCPKCEMIRPTMDAGETCAACCLVL